MFWHAVGYVLSLGFAQGHKLCLASTLESSDEVRLGRQSAE